MDPQQQADKFLAVITQHKGIIYKIANLYCRQEEDRKDLIQEIIFQLWRSFGNYKEQYRLSTWLYKISLNVAISYYRKDRRRSTTALPLTDSIIDMVPGTEQDGTEQQLQLLQRFVNELKPLDRALMILYLEEKTYKEMAEILGLTETNIATRISRVKDKLKLKFLTVNN
jgi:RNA polymerase sigma-70 factor (ECF subfamily)